MAAAAKKVARKPVKERKKAANPGFDPNRQNVVSLPAVVKKELRLLLRDAFDGLGGVAWLIGFVQRDDQNARTFLQVLARTMPMELVGKDGQPLSIMIVQADGTQKAVNLNPDEVQAPPIEGEAHVLNS